MLIFNAPESDAGLSRSLNLDIFQSEPHTAVYYRFGGLIDQCCDLSPNWVLMMPISLSMEFWSARSTGRIAKLQATFGEHIIQGGCCPLLA